MKKIAIRTKKGGVGKTTIAAHIGYWLANKGKTVCLVDTDPQYNLTTMLGVSQEQVSGNILSILEGRVFSDITLEVRPNLILVPGNKRLSYSSQVMDARLPELTLRNKLSGFGFSWDYFIFDCPPATSILTDNVLCYVEEVWSPLQLEYLSLEGLEQVIDEISEINSAFSPHGVDVRIKAIIPSMLDARVKLSEEVSEAAMGKYGEVITEPIRRNIKISEAPSFGQTVFEYDPKGKASKNFERLARRLM